MSTTNERTSVERLVIDVTGRPAPQGSKRIQGNGAMREQSAYLPAWRAAVKRATYERYRELGIAPDALPAFVGPVSVSVTFYLDHGDRIDGPPDVDKLVRSTFDALTQARVWEDDSRVVSVWASKRPVLDSLGIGTANARAGARIEIWG